MLREDTEALKQDTEPLDRVLGAGRHLLALINDILDLSKIEAGRMELALSSFALTPLIADVIKTIEPLAAKNSNKVTVLGTMRADQMRLRQALLNLMSNANKFTDRGTISIDARQGQENGRDWITLAIADTGIGMTAEQMGKIFQEFSQASSTARPLRSGCRELWKPPSPSNKHGVAALHMSARDAVDGSSARHVSAMKVGAAKAPTIRRSYPCKPSLRQKGGKPTQLSL